jgi:hypothetical protein
MNLEKDYNYPPVDVEMAVLANPPFRATSNRDYRGEVLPSAYGAEVKHFSEVEHARKWLREIRFGGKLEQYDSVKKQYRFLELVEASK